MLWCRDSLPSFFYLDNKLSVHQMFNNQWQLANVIPLLKTLPWFSMPWGEAPVSLLQSARSCTYSPPKVPPSPLTILCSSHMDQALYYLGPSLDLFSLPSMSIFFWSQLILVVVGWMVPPRKRYIHPESVTMILFGKSVFANVIMLKISRWDHPGLPSRP